MRDVFARWTWHLNVIGIFCGLWLSVYGALTKTDVMLHGRPGPADVAFQAMVDARALVEVGWWVAITLGIVLIVRLAVRFCKDAIWLRDERALVIFDLVRPLDVDPPAHE